MNKVVRDIDEINCLLETNPNSKKRYLQKRLLSDLENILNKYEYMYDKYVIRNKKISNMTSERERDIAIVQKSINTFFPYILAFNIAQLTDDDV